MAHYVDGFLIPIKKSKLKAYKKMAQIGCKTWMKHGALSYYECVADEHMAYGTGFKKLCKLKPNETVIFAYIVYKSKAHRNQVNKKVHKEFSDMGGEAAFEMPYDMKRFSSAGFKALVKSK
ncbi:MAG: DUF1428 domain-containing protein [Bdellovibrionaceae bacterium]|nr:DUF1428 domain-containing protein [Pseudobdellovibrionaceae bacterium]